MRLTALIFNRYRAFKERQRVELTPITIIIGKNGSGKSIITRLPILLANALSEQAEGPLDLRAGNVPHASSFQDLVNARGSLPFSLGAEIGSETEKFSFETTLRYVHETRSLAIEKFQLIHDGKDLFVAEISSVEELTQEKPTFNILFNGEPSEPMSLVFIGLFPVCKLLPDKFGLPLGAVLDYFREALPPPSYLGPFREEPSDNVRNPNPSIRGLGPRGERALEILADDGLRRGGILSAKVDDWFATQMGQGVVVDVTGNDPKVRVSNTAGDFTGGLGDTGAGFSQSLPVVVQHFAYRAGRLATKMLIVEQPELHLHPAAHGALTDLIIQSGIGAEFDPAICVVETHSEQIIMRIRRRIAEGTLDPDFVSICSLNHIDIGELEQTLPIKTIRFDKTGNPDAWPAGVFEEALGDLTAMRQGARERGL